MIENTVGKAMFFYKKQRFWHKLYSIKVLGRIVYTIKPDSQYPASLYSNIPIRLSKTERSSPLTKEHLLHVKKLPQKCVVLIDEIGSFCSQYDFDNPLVMEQINTLIRFFRHFVDGKMLLTDQSSDNIVVGIRRRINIIYNLTSFDRWLKVLPFYRIDMNPIQCIEDVNNVIDQAEQEEKFHFFGYLPYTQLIFKRKYKSRCYMKLYYENAVNEIKEFAPDLYTNYLIDIDCSDEDRKKYKHDRNNFKSYLYNKELM